MTKAQQIFNIEEAIALITVAQDLLDDALQGTKHNSHFKASGRFGIDQLLDNENAGNDSLFSLKNSINK